ncbi:MAG: hypothetical protein ACRYHQ_41950 [Janthinobacterium lividum]
MWLRGSERKSKSTRDDEEPRRADAVPLVLAIWLSLAAGAAFLERVKLPEPTMPTLDTSLAMTAGF